MGVETDISRGVFSFFRDNLPAGLGIAYPNSVYSGDRPYLSIMILPAPTFTRTIDGKGTTRRGIVQVDVNTEADIGSIEAEEFVDQIIELLLPPARISEGETTIRIDEEGQAAPGFNSGSDYVVPVSFPYIVLKTRG